MLKKIESRDLPSIAAVAGLCGLLCFNVALGLTKGFGRPDGGILIRGLGAPGVALGWGGVMLLLVAIPYALLAWLRGRRAGKLLSIGGAVVLALAVASLAGTLSSSPAAGGGRIGGAVGGWLRSSLGTGLAATALAAVSLPALLLSLAPLLLANGVGRVADLVRPEEAPKPWYPERKVGADGDEEPVQFANSHDVGPIRFRDEFPGEPTPAPAMSTVTLSPPPVSGPAVRKQRPIPGVRFADEMPGASPAPSAEPEPAEAPVAPAATASRDDEPPLPAGVRYAPTPIDAIPVAPDSFEPAVSAQAPVDVSWTPAEPVLAASAMEAPPAPAEASPDATPVVEMAALARPSVGESTAGSDDALARTPSSPTDVLPDLDAPAPGREEPADRVEPSPAVAAVVAAARDALAAATGPVVPSSRADRPTAESAPIPETSGRSSRASDAAADTESEAPAAPRDVAPPRSRTRGVSTAAPAAARQPLTPADAVAAIATAAQTLEDLAATPAASSSPAQRLEAELDLEEASIARQSRPSSTRVASAPSRAFPAASAAREAVAAPASGESYRRKLASTGLLDASRPQASTAVAAPERPAPRAKPRPARPKDVHDAIRGLFSSLPLDELPPVQPVIDPEPAPTPPVDVPGQTSLFDAGGAASSRRTASDDPLFRSSVDAAIERGCASLVLLKRKLGVGYARAASLIEALVAEGILGEMTASGSRPTLVSAAEWEQRSRARQVHAKAS